MRSPSPCVPVGGGQKLAALEQIVAAEGVEGGGVMYVGDSITDTPPLAAVKAWGGVSLSFNGNGYAIAAAEFAAASPNAEVQAQLAEAFAAGGRDAVEAAVRSWPKPKKGTPAARQGAGDRGRRRRGAREARRGLRRRAAERPRRARRAPRLTLPAAMPSSPQPARLRLWPASAPPDPPSAPALSLAGVTVWEWDARLRRRQPILTGIDWTVGPGEQWAVLGPNGAGKSTLLDVAAGMRHPSRGEVRILGETVGRVDLRALRERIGHVDVKTEEAFSPRRSALDVVLTGATGTIQVLEDRLDEATRQRAAQTARAVRLRRRGASTRSRRARRASGGASCWLAP